MTRHKLLFTGKARKDLLSLDKKTQKRVVLKLQFFVSQNQPLAFAKKIKDPRLGTFRFRVGDWRVIFDVDKKGNINILMILRIKHRKEAYL